MGELGEGKADREISQRWRVHEESSLVSVAMYKKIPLSHFSNIAINFKLNKIVI